MQSWATHAQSYTMRFGYRWAASISCWFHSLHVLVRPRHHCLRACACSTHAPDRRRPTAIIRSIRSRRLTSAHRRRRWRSRWFPARDPAALVAGRLDRRRRVASVDPGRRSVSTIERAPEISMRGTPPPTRRYCASTAIGRVGQDRRANHAPPMSSRRCARPRCTTCPSRRRRPSSAGGHDRCRHRLGRPVADGASRGDPRRTSPTDRSRPTTSASRRSTRRPR